MKKRVFIWGLFFALIVGGCAPSHKTNPLREKDIQARFDLANSYLAQGKPRLSLLELSKIEKRCEHLPYFYFVKGMVYLSLRDARNAVRYFKKALSLNPAYGDVWNNLGLAYVLLHKEEDAERCFKKALSIESYTTPEYAAHNLSVLYEREKKYPLAIEYEKKALLQNWRYLPSYIHLAHLYVKIGKYKRAVACLNRARESFPDNPRIYYLLGENYLRINREEDAKFAFERAVELSKDPSLTRMARDYLEMLK